MSGHDIFKKCVMFVLKEEGGYSNHKKDVGGETNHGISDMRDGVADGMTDTDGDGLPDVKISDLQVHQASNIYWRDYWLKSRSDRLPPPIAAFVFDSAVNCGAKNASRFLQRALNITVDGKTGPITISHAQSSDWSATVDKMHEIRADFYRSRATFSTFGRGWLKRNDRCKTFAKELL